MGKNFWSKFQCVFPFIGPIVLLILFSFTAGEKFWMGNNLLNIVSTMIPLILGGCGMIFVVAQGSCDVSVGSIVALTGTVAAFTSQRLGFASYFPVAILLGALIGLLNGTIIAKFKVPSLMVTLSMLIALRAFVVYITNGAVIYVSTEVLDLENFSVKIPIFIVLVIIMYYLFEYTKTGYFSKSIGENEVSSEYTGVPINRYKIIAFVLSGLMAGIVGALTVSRIGGVDPSMGNFFELEVMIALFVGGIPVTGGSESKFYRLLTGALTLSILENGLTLSKVSAETSELIEGLILIGVVFYTLFLRTKFIQSQSAFEN